MWDTISSWPERSPEKQKSDESFTGFRASAIQWADADPKPWCKLEGYDFIDFPDFKRKGASRAIRYVKNELAELIGSQIPQWARTTRKIRLDNEHEELRAWVKCETHVSKTTAKRLGEMYRPLRTRHNIKQIFLLQFHHANLNLFADFLESFITQYANRRMRLFDPRRSELRRWNLRAFMTDAQLYRRFTAVGSEMTGTIESLLDVVLALQEENDNPRLAALGALLSLFRDMSQLDNVQTLALLAAIFLPLSLSAGVLSMQSRFKDLGDLLYDFFGVVVLLGAIAALFLVAMFLFSSVSELESRLWRYRRYKAFVRPVLLFTMACIALTFGAIVLTSFVVGMFKDVVLGAKILGYGLLVAIFGPIVIAIVFLICGSIVDVVQEGVVDKVPQWKFGKRGQK
ncbi:hypothetical protein EDB81DRAFT_916252 [Dactylonectria macrodidyma]|uniref:Uncharacterized protein n=1 Tax=Dactylonectria macrodidyma TaxID=307937 RepID=A0A9P9DEC9_9HYPO|nr:hypothetical protein EDB81DRAFT_916252 [Dactylonectria macrodidyma]